MSSDGGREPASLLHERPEVHARRWFHLSVMCLSVLLVVMALSGLTVALPTIQRDLDTTGTELIWIVDSYAIVFAGLLMVAGAIGDKFGRKGALQAGLVGFGVGAIVAAAADTAIVVISGRALMGAGAAFIMPATLSIITAVFPRHERTKAIAIWAGWAGAGGAIGPVVTGLILEGWAIVPNLGWEATFLVNIPVVAVVLCGVSVFTPKSRESTAHPLDPVGGFLSIAAIAVSLFGIIQGPDTGWRSGTILGAFALAGLLLVAFVWWEMRAPFPMLPMDLFRIRLFSAGSATVGLSFALMIGFFVMQALYLQFVLGYDALETGLANLPLAVATVIVAPPSAALTERYGLGPVLSAGFAIMAAGLVVLTTVTTETTYPMLAAAFVVLGVGMALATAPATGAIMISVPLDKAGVGSAVNDGATELGGALGIAVAGSIITTIYRSGVDLESVGLPPGDLDTATESIGGAVSVAADVDTETGAAVLSTARDAFVDAFAFTMLLGAIASVIGAIVIWLALRPAPAAR